MALLKRAARASMRALRRMAVAASVVAALWCVAAAREGTAGERAPTPHEVEAAFLVNFASYVEWPTDALAEDRFVIGVLGRDPFGQALDTIAEGQKVSGRRIVVRHVASADAASACNVLFVSSSEASNLDARIGALAGRPVLTVSDMRDFARRGGMIQFRIIDNRVRFEIDVAAARRSELTVSSHLLKLAVHVHDDAPPSRR